LQSYSKTYKPYGSGFETNSKTLLPSKTQQLQKFADRNDIDGFTKALKHIAYSLSGIDGADHILPCMEKLFYLVDATVSYTFILDVL